MNEDVSNPLKKGGFCIAMLVYERVNQLNWPYRVLFIQDWTGVLNGGTVSCTVSYLSVCYKYKVQNQWKNMWRQQSPAIPKGCKRKTLKTHHFCWVVSFQLPNLLPIWHPQECEKTQRIMLLKQQTHIMFEGPPGFCVESSFLAVVCVCVCVFVCVCVCVCVCGNLFQISPSISLPKSTSGVCHHNHLRNFNP